MPGSVIPVSGLILGPVGSISQTDFPLLSPRKVQAADTLNINFGDPAVLNLNNTYSSVAQFILNGGTLNGSMPLGVAKDTVKTNNYYPLPGGVGSPGGFYMPDEEVNLLTRGSINVAVNHGTPAGAGSPVFIRAVINGAISGAPVGGFEAAADAPAPTAAALAGNTGNTTLGTLTAGTAPLNGAYDVIYTDATHFNVFDPTGKYVGSGVNGTAFTSTGVNFTATTGGTAMVRGDGFTVTVASKTILVPNFVWKTGILSTDPATSQITAQLTILNRLMC
jgi:hypothetical protein